MLSHDDLGQRLDFKRIPVLPPGLPHLLKALMDDAIGFIELAGIIERYPSISARLIALSNSAWSCPVDEITSLETAITRLGFDTVRSTCIALAVSSAFNPARCAGFDAKYFWTTSLLAADGAAWLATCRNSSVIEPPTARAAGLIHNLGLLWLADQLPEQLRQAIKLAHEDENLHLADALLYLIGFDYCDVGRALGLAWKLPDTLVNAMARHADEDFPPDTGDCAGLVGLTVTMLRAVQHDSPWPVPQIRLASLAISHGDATKVFDRLTAQLPEIQKLAEMLFAR